MTVAASEQVTIKYSLLRTLALLIGMILSLVFSSTISKGQSPKSSAGMKEESIIAVTPTDYGSIQVPKDLFPKGNGTPIPIYVPPVGSDQNADGWKPIQELSGEKVKFSREKLMENAAHFHLSEPPDAPGVDSGAAAGWSIVAGLLPVFLTALEENRFRITIQENEESGDRRAIIEIFVDAGAALRANAGGVVSTPDPSTNSLMCVAFSQWIMEKCGLPKTKGYYQGYWIIDKKHKDTEYIAYFALLPKVNAVLISPIVYPGDQFLVKNVTNPFALISPTALELTGEAYAEFWSYRMPLEASDTIKLLNLLPISVDSAGASIREWKAGHTPSHPGVSMSDVPTEAEMTKGPIDLVFCIDATGSMTDDIARVKGDASNLIQRLREKCSSLRIGLVTYRDFAVDGSKHLETNLPLTDDVDDIITAIQGITTNGGGDEPEDVYDGLMAAIGMPWRDGVSKFIVLMGDAPAKDPDHAGHTRDTVAAAAFAVDPAHVYALAVGIEGKVSPETLNEFTKIAASTGGKAYSVEDADALSSAVDNAVEAAITDHAGEYAGGAAMPSADWQTSLLASTLVGIFMLGLFCGIVIWRRRAFNQFLAPVPLAWLQVYEPGVPPRNVPVTLPVLRIGRAPGNGVQLADPQVAPYHADLIIGPQGAEVSDLGSPTGIRVNGQHVGRALLRPGDHLHVGKTVILYWRS